MKVFVEFNNGKTYTYSQASVKEDTRGFWITDHLAKIFVPLYNINKIIMIED